MSNPVIYHAKNLNTLYFGLGHKRKKSKTPQADKTPSPLDTLQPHLFSGQKADMRRNRFVVIGDPGSGKKPQWEIAEQMHKRFKSKPFASVLVLGDNVYEHGEPKLFKERIYDPYKKLFDEKVRFYPILGNHDVNSGHQDQQLAYWGAPPFYSITLGNPDSAQGRPSVELFAIDTTVMLPGSFDCYKNNPDLAHQKATIQMQWLTTALKNSKADMKIVMGHYPAYSSGVHGLLEKSCLHFRQQIEPILKQHGVDLYLSGHEHHYERTQPIGGVTHIVSGAAGKLFKHTLPRTHFPQAKLEKKYHFMAFEITPQGLAFEAIDRHGKTIDQGLIPKKSEQLSKLA